MEKYYTDEREGDDKFVIDRYYYLDLGALKFANHMIITKYKFKIKNCRRVYKLLKIDGSNLLFEYEL